jgi:prophage antirepressor-like protein
MGDKKTAIKLFESKEIRTAWDSEKEEWYFSIQDVVEALTDSADVKQYIKKMKSRDPELNLNWGTICTPLQMLAPDGKMRKTQAANTEGIFRIIQSIPSPKAEPFKTWLAKVGAERLEEIADPEKAMERAVATYKAKGYSDKWISQRLRTIEIRKELTDEWQNAGIKESKEFAALTNILTIAWSGKSVQEYKKLKGLKKENLRDNMTNTELALNLLAEVSATEISRNRQPEGFSQTKEVTIAGGKIAGDARKALEEQLGHSVLSETNATTPELLDDTENNK